MRKIFLVVLTIVLLITVGCQNTQEKEAIEPKSTVETPKMPQYIVEGRYGNCSYVTVIPPYTKEGLLLIIEEEKLGRDSFKFFLPNAPRVENDSKSVLSDKVLPDDNYCIASYIYYEKEDEWMKIK